MDLFIGSTDQELFFHPRKLPALSQTAPDINLPFSSDRPPPSSWRLDSFATPDLALGRKIYEAELARLHFLRKCSRKCIKRGDGIWGAWFFFNFYFIPVLSEKSRAKINRNCNGLLDFDKSDLDLDVFLVQHEMENMYMWVFKEMPEHALGKMQLRSYMNGHCLLGEPEFPFSVERGFVRSHRIRRKHYHEFSDRQCIHGIEIVRRPNLDILTEGDRRRWIELTGRDLNFSIPLEASNFEAWRNRSNIDFELERPPPLQNRVCSHPRRQLIGSGLKISTNPLNPDALERTPQRSKIKNSIPRVTTEGIDLRPLRPSWIAEFSGLMRHAHGPVTAAKTIYEDGDGYLIMVSLPLSDHRRVRVCWKNSFNHGVVKISCVSTGRMPCLKRQNRTFQLADPAVEHCPPGEFVREIPLATRIPEGANIEAYYDETGTVLEIVVPKRRLGPEEHEVQVSMRPPHLKPANL